jgi:hypothetical protein
MPLIQSQHPGQTSKTLRAVLVTGGGLLLALLWGIYSLLHHETGVLIVTSRPDGAEVILNRRPTDLLTTAFLSDLPADSFVVSLRLDGHRPIPPQQGCRIYPNDTTRVTFFMAPIARGDYRDLPTVSGSTPNWEWRSVKINSDPPGAGLVVDDRELGVQTPVTVLLEAGLHHLEARWADGAMAFKNITIHPAQTQPDLMFRPVTYNRSGVRKDSIK